MRTISTVLLVAGMMSAFSSADAQVNLVASFVADPGKTKATYNMASCSKTKSEVYSHIINFYEDGSFEQSFDLTGDLVSDVVLAGLWAKPKPGKIELIYDGNIAEGASGMTAWSDVFTTMESNLRTGCKDVSVKLIYATVRLQKFSLGVNGKGDRATLVEDVDSYAQGNNTRPGKAGMSIKAPGKFQRAL